jgi:predicted NBD/HSP70 family sugar kinase
MTGLSRTTVGSLVADLQALGLVVEQEGSNGNGHSRPGRPGVPLRLEPAAGVVVGIDFDHEEVRVALADLSSTVLGESCQKIDVDHSADEAIDAAVAMMHDLRQAAGVDEAQIIGAGVGLPGPIDRRTGTVGSTAILPGWVGLQAGLELARRLGVDVEVENDANLGAIAEASFGAGRGLSDILYVRLGSGLGAGLVLGGRLHHGKTGLAGEIGHVNVLADGAVCRCGRRGCLETIAAEGALKTALRPALGPDATTRDLLALVRSGDLLAYRVFNDAGRAIGRVLADLCNALNPEAVIVGGELSEAGEPLLEGIRASLDGYALPGAAQAVHVLPGELGERAEVLGALALVIADTDSLSSVGFQVFARQEEVRAGSR